MNKGRKIIITILLSIFIFTYFSNLKYVVAFKEEDTKYTDEGYLREVELKKDITFDGVYDGYSYMVNVDDLEGLKAMNFNISYLPTNILSNEIKSYLTFSVNNNKFFSIEVGKENVSNYKVNIPLELISKGINEVKVEGYLRISNESCTDDYNTANWLWLKEGSKIEVVEGAKIVSDEIASFPYNLGKNNNSTNKVIIPDNYTDGEISAALNFLILLGKLNSCGELVKYSERGDLSNCNTIIIGNSQFVNEYNIGNLNLDNINLEEKAYVNVQSSDNKGRADLKQLFLLSNNEEMLDSLVKFLMNENLTSQIFNNNYELGKEVDILEKREEITNKIFFSDMSLNNLKVEGLFRREMNFSYSIPLNKQFEEGEGLTLYLRYAQNLDFQRSLFTIYINDIPIGSKKLEIEKSEEDIVRFNIPIDLLDTNYMNIKLAYDLYIEEVDCEKKETKEPWGMVTNNSYIEVATKERENLLFNKYPYPFVENYEINDVYAILPDVLVKEELNNIGNVFNYMGRHVKYNNGNLKVATVSKVKDDYKSHNFIIYGTPFQNTLIKDLNSSLWLKYSNDYLTFISNEKIELTEDYSKNIATFQLDNNIYKSDKNMLILTSPNEDLLRKSMIYLGDESKVYKLYGDGVIVDLEGDIRAFTYKEIKEEGNIKKEISKLNRDERNLIIVLGLILFFGVIAFSLYTYKNRK